MKFAYYLILFLRKIIASCKTVAFKTVSTAHYTVKFGRSADVVNIHGGRNRLIIGQETFIDGQLLLLQKNATIHIGDNCFIGSNSRIWSATDLKIGNRVLISHDVNIHDSDAHTINSESRSAHFKTIFHTGHPPIIEQLKAKPITIHDDAWIGFGSTILKGVTIGKRAVVGANSVVLTDVPDDAIVVGNPATVVKFLKSE
jgi:maltose O-acetyltransferase